MPSDLRLLPKHFFFVVLLMVPITGMGIDLYAPSLPWIVKALHTTPAMVKLTLPMYLIGYSFGSLLFGPISDSYGRKLTVYVGLTLYIVSCLIMIFVPNIGVMWGFRIVQGAGVGAIAITFRSFVSDTLAPGPQMNKFASWMTIFWSVGPIVAPFIGGYLQAYFGWQANFVFFIVYAVLLFLLLLTIPETIKQKQPFTFKAKINDYKKIARAPVFWGGVLMMGTVYSLIVCFNVIGPFLIQDVLHYTPIDFGHIALVMGFAFFLGGLLNRKLLEHTSVVRIMPYALSGVMLCATVMCFLAVFMNLNLGVYCVSSFLIFFCMAGIYPAAMSRCMGLFPKIAGSANALTVFMFGGVTALVSILASFLRSDTMFPVAVVYVTLGLLCVAAFYGLMRRGFDAENK